MSTQPATNERTVRTERVRSFVLETLGFDLVGFARAERLDAEGARLEEWLDAGRNGSMEWLNRNREVLVDPREIVSGATSVIVVAKNYYTPFEHPDDSNHAKISRYAWGRDYHRVLPKRLRKLHQFIIEEIDASAANRWFVDAGPMMEKAWAVRAGLGWMGKHTNVITRSHGSWVFLGTLITTLDLEPTSPIADFCGSCQRCIDACPTEAITAPYQLDARRCISYVTIEEQPKEEIDAERGATFDNWVFGCDICQDVCPWNKFQQPTDEPDFEPREGRLDLTFDELLRMSDEEFEERFRGSPVMRAKAEGMRRNARGVGGETGSGGTSTE